MRSQSLFFKKYIFKIFPLELTYNKRNHYSILAIMQSWCKNLETRLKSMAGFSQWTSAELWGIVWAWVTWLETFRRQNWISFSLTIFRKQRLASSEGLPQGHIIFLIEDCVRFFISIAWNRDSYESDLFEGWVVLRSEMREAGWGRGIS